MVASTTAAPIPKPVHLRVAPEVVEKETAAAEKPEQRPAFKAGVTIALSVVGVAIAVGAFFAWKHFSNPPAPPPTKAAPAIPKGPEPKNPASPPSSSAPVAAVPSPVAPASSTASTPADTSNEGPVKIDLDHATPEVAPPSPAPASHTLSTTSVPGNTTLAPGVVAKTGVTITNSGASPEFRAFIANAKISGVFQGENARAFINGRVMRVGELVDAKLGITFDSIDAEHKQIVFKDRAGAIVTRKY